MRRNKWTHILVGLGTGFAIGALLMLCLSDGGAVGTCSEGPVPRDPLALVGMDSDEDVDNSNRTLVFVGVMTAAQYLESRARAVAETWARDLPGRLAFFSSEGSRAEGLSLVSLPGVDDGYPPQKKSFLMLMYMYERFGERFEWFMRADDDVYVRGDRLEEFLRSVDSRKPQFIGQAGRGTSAERDALGLDYDENFCMGGPGVLLSRETLRRVAPHVGYCLEHLYTSHEDVELGRCVAKFAGVSCTWSYDMQTILHHNSSGAAAYTGRLKRREVHRAITLHPVKDHRHMYRLHSHFKNLRIAELRERSLDLHRDIAVALQALGRSPTEGGLFPALPGDPAYLGNNTVLGAPVDIARFRPDSLDEVLPFDFVSKSVYTFTHSNPKRRIEGPLKEALDDVIREVMDIINSASRQRGRVIDFNELLYGYTRVDPLHGADHVLDLLLRYRRYRGRKLTAAVRRHAYLQQSFTGVEIRELPIGEPPPAEDPTITDGTATGGLEGALRSGLGGLRRLWGDGGALARRVRFAVPLIGRLDAFVRFMRNYEDVVLRPEEAADLTVVLHRDPARPDLARASVALLDRYRELYPGAGLRLLDRGEAPFSRGAALTAAARACDDDDLLFFVDVDMAFDSVTLRRIRTGTIPGERVYSPIVFSEYDPRAVSGAEFNGFEGDAPPPSPRERGTVDDRLGYFRRYGFGILSVHKRDLESAGGFDPGIEGWGLEDVRLFEALIRSRVDVFRAPDASLVHVHHDVSCDPGLERSQYLMCLGTRASTMAGERHLTYYILNHPEVLWPRDPAL